MEVHASLRRLRMSPRKVRLVVDSVRGLPVKEAEMRLSFLQKAAAEPVLKLIRSASANAEHNFKLDPSSLIVKSIAADDGPTYKRFRPRAFGRAAQIRKRTTHITITLVPKESKVESQKSKVADKKVEDKKVEVPKKETSKPKTR